MDFYSHNPTGRLMSRITYDAAVIRDAISTGIADTFMMPIKIIACVVWLVVVKINFGISWEYIVVPAVIFPLIVYPVVRIGKKLRKISSESQEKIADINNMLLETITGIKLVKSFNMQDYEQNRFEEHNSKFYKLSLKSIKRMKIISPVTESVSIICASIILWLAGKDIVSGQISAGPFIAFLGAVFMVIKPMKKLSNVYGINQQALAAADRIFNILDTPVSVVEKEDPIILESFNEAIELENVNFRYDEGKEYVLKNINLKVNKGEVIALVGPSGGGKTTLVNLINRFYDPEEGTVKIDGNDVKDICIKSLMEQIGLVTQETLLFNDALKANLCYGHEEINEEKVIQAAKAANAHRFIKDLPKGYDTVIGERGVKLSGGQRQRLALARAVYKNPPILILDEATSQLDSESERLVQDAINTLMQGRTVIAIAHRLSTITHADRIVVIEKGEIVDIGSHSELLTRSPLYKRLYELQFSI
jgi:ATP-binding cassette, subfamily B, bacterial MsbA